jgi:hypothetical protein
MGWNWINVTDAAGVGGAWNPVSTPGGDVYPYVFAAQGTQHVFYRAVQEGHIHELWRDNAGWHFNDLTTALNLPSQTTFGLTAYVFNARCTQHVIYIGDEDFHIHELWWDSGGGWHQHDLTDATGVPSGLGLGPGSPQPAAYVFASRGTQHVNYRRNDGHVIELWCDSKGAWHNHDLTVAAGATDVPFSKVYSYAFDAQETQHVIYQGEDSHIIELWCDSKGAWRHHDLTVATGAPLGFSRYTFGASGYVFDARRTQHVNYLGQDFHIHELWCDRSGAWHHHDLTDATGADPGNENSYPIGYLFAAQNTQHVNYRGGDNHVHELWCDSNGTWHHHDLTVATGAPLCAYNPIGYTFDAQGTQHVFYEGENLNLIELFWGP